jgi:hypothetical protein
MTLESREIDTTLYFRAVTGYASRTKVAGDNIGIRVLNDRGRLAHGVERDLAQHSAQLRRYEFAEQMRSRCVSTTDVL